MRQTSEDRELQAKIAQLTARINIHKKQQKDQSHKAAAYGARQGCTADGAQDRGRGRSSWSPQRGTPYGTRYGAPRGRCGNLYSNGALVLNNQANTSSRPGAKPSTAANAANGSHGPLRHSIKASGRVVKRKGTVQLISPAILQRERDQALEQQRQQHKLKMLGKYTQIIGDALARMRESLMEIQETTRTRNACCKSEIDGPRIKRESIERTSAGSVPFVSSTQGNIYRIGYVRSHSNKLIKKIDEPCLKFSTIGACEKGPRCPHYHDPDKVAICKDYLLTGKCNFRDACDLSHDATPNRVPPCMYFLASGCTKDNCRYPHITSKALPTAQGCPAFGRFGYCESGAECTERHVFGCLQYAKHESCRNARCQLLHVDKHGRLRATAARAPQSPDPSKHQVCNESDDESDDDDDDDDCEEEFVLGSSSNGHELSQQNDFVPL